MMNDKAFTGPLSEQMRFKLYRNNGNNPEQSNEQILSWWWWWWWCENPAEQHDY